MSPKNDNEYYNKIKLTTWFCGILACVYIVIMIVCICTLHKSDFENGRLIDNSVRKRYGYITGFVFLVDSLGLFYTTCTLIRNLKRDFAFGM